MPDRIVPDWHSVFGLSVHAAMIINIFYCGNFTNLQFWRSHTHRWTD